MRNPRNVLVTLIVAAVAPLLASASGLHVHGTLNGESDYVLSDDNHEIVLHSDAGTHGVVVDRTRPSPLDGLRGGDVIVSVDGHAVAQVDDILSALRHRAKTPAAIVVRRAGASVALTWSYDQFKQLFPEPPPPPAPPPPPPPPPHG